MPDEQLTFGWSDRNSAPAPLVRLPRAVSLAPRLRGLADRGVFVGTSSWKYPGWLGQVYDPARYTVRGKLSHRRFNDECLAEYATVFPTVCGDFAFYQFPSPEAWERTFAQVPAGFRFSLKMPEDVTVERYPDLPRYGRRAGQANPGFLDAALVTEKLLTPLEVHRDKLGVLIFQFGTFRAGPMTAPQAFAEALGHMLDRLPCERFRFAVEVRNRDFLNGGGYYLACLREHGVAHCLDSWTRMPPVHEQMQKPEVFTANHTAARFLLRPGRTYQRAVEAFSPYERVQDPYPEGRDALRDLIARFVPDERSAYIFVNNRFEGSAIETIEAVAPEHLD